ncbi:MFS transporter [Commensalibacter oyaizuii]|uniref:MFS transporter n=1 Tax=Commensalibacter oyaizuii TaxID=3043873 RepID=A0ABT6Q2J4_9PROT|nr:MFS transporter [Commensalibacter sp. TBRC 16381]MDI2091240.1 MFS transporter [Commensalibacter sp. TBRC 16381]
MTSLSINNIPRQRWLRILPPILITCIISYMDRLNVAFAMPGGMSKELMISVSMEGMLSGIFFIGYIFLQVPGGKIAVHGSGKKFIGWSLVAWIIISILSSIVTNYYQLLGLRFLLGVAEGGMLPVVLTMISNWFPDSERGRANAVVIMFVPIAGMISAPICGWLLSVASWRWLFVTQGVLCLVLLAVWYFTICDRPQEAKWISNKEKQWLLDALSKEQAEISSDQSGRKSSLMSVINNKTMWHLTALNFFYQAGIYGYTLWLPTILKELTNSSMGKVGVLAILPYVGTMAGMLLFSFLSDRTGKRRVFIYIPLMGFAICMFLSVYLKNDVFLSYIALIGCGFFLQAAAGIFWTIPSHIFSAEIAGGARGIINAISNIGGFCGPYAVGILISLYNQDVGVYSLAVALAISAIFAWLLPVSCDPHKEKPVLSMREKTT